MSLTKGYLKDLVYQVNGAAIEVHKSIDPGLLECVYHQCLKKELELRKINFVSELSIPLKYKGFELDSKLRCDLYIENALVVELKSVNEITPIC
ncbi:GxxExxY protein [Flavobacterium faecale]|uniref:GxxExxY protein n=1 Tax=Flavobacterium faecale TaxID=1355330 RepID=UPI003AAD3385